MQHVAIDLGGRESQICVRAEDGRILHEGKIATLGIEGYLKRQPPSRVVLETCAEAFGIADKVLRFVAAIDDVGRFHDAHSVQSFLGLTPGEHSSSNRQQRTGITKAGPAPVRRALTQAAWSFRRTCYNHPIALWAAQIELRRGKFVATIAVARKLAGVLFAIWRDGSRYDSSHQSRAQA